MRGNGNGNMGAMGRRLARFGTNGPGTHRCISSQPSTALSAAATAQQPPPSSALQARGQTGRTSTQPTLSSKAGEPERGGAGGRGGGQTPAYTLTHLPCLHTHTQLPTHSHTCPALPPTHTHTTARERGNGNGKGNSPTQTHSTAHSLCPTTSTLPLPHHHQWMHPLPCVTQPGWARMGPRGTVGEGTGD